MFILHLALGGCIKAPPVRFGLTADTGGHIAYVLDAAAAQAALAEVTRVSVITRLFDDGQLGVEHALAVEPFAAGASIDRIATSNRFYLEKEALAAELPAFTDALCRHLAGLPQRPDLIHAHFADAAAIALAVRRRFGIPFVYTPHALGLDKQRHQPGGDSLAGRIAAEREAIDHADAIIVSTRDEADRQVQAYGPAASKARIRCIPPGVPRHAAACVHTSPLVKLADWLSEPDKPVVLAVARPVIKKNLAALARAFMTTPSLAARANLVILAGQHGDRSSPEEREVVRELSRLCSDRSLQGRMALPPRHTVADVACLYRQAAQGGVFVNPALHEPFGLTLIEAASAGVPVVTTRNGGPEEIAGNIGHALLVDPHDEAAIGKACLAVVSEPSLHRRLSQAGLQNVRHYSWSSYAERSVSLYASLRAGRSGKAVAATEADQQLGASPDQSMSLACKPFPRRTAA